MEVFLKIATLRNFEKCMRKLSWLSLFIFEWSQKTVGL